MPMLSVPAIYDGNEVKLLEGAPVRGRYRVLVTFLEPAPEGSNDSPSPHPVTHLLEIWPDFDLSFKNSQLPGSNK